MLGFILFYGVRYYTGMLLQGVNVCNRCEGIYSWSHVKGGNSLKIAELSSGQWLTLVPVIVAVGLAWGYGVNYFSGIYPQYIEEPAYPYIDALLTIASIAAQLMLTRKKLDNWLLWLIINSCSIVLYTVVGIYFTVVLYVVYCAIALNAYRDWTKTWHKESEEQKIV